jgi:hypothetical protein
MISFELNGKSYSAPKDWTEISFSKFLQYLEEVSSEVPKPLKEFFEEREEIIQAITEEKYTEEEIAELSQNVEKIWEDLSNDKKLECYNYFALCVGFWCGLDAKTIQDSMNLEELESAFWAIELGLSNMSYDESFTGFEIGGIEYLLPTKHMEGSTVAEFAEASQFQENMEGVTNGEWSSMLDVMVVLCRPKDEKYSYEKKNHEIRKKIFKKLTMDNVINVAFFLLNLNITLSHNLLIYSLQEWVAQKEVKQLQTIMDGS